jgi:hypothetical protein
MKKFVFDLGDYEKIVFDLGEKITHSGFAK